MKRSHAYSRGLSRQQGVLSVPTKARPGEQNSFPFFDLSVRLDKHESGSSLCIEEAKSIAGRRVCIMALLSKMGGRGQSSSTPSVEVFGQRGGDFSGWSAALPSWKAPERTHMLSDNTERKKERKKYYLGRGNSPYIN
eukprot:1144060-Pelagomonas_calceolata.AAC.2